MRPTLRLVVLTLLTLSAPFLVRAQETLHAVLNVIPITNNQSLIMFEGERADAVVAAATYSTENGIEVRRGHLNQPLAVWKWTVNGVENGNSLYGKLTVDGASHAFYTAPGGNYYGPIRIAATVNLPDGSQETVLRTVYVIPKKLRYNYSVAVGCKCSPGGDAIPSLFNTQVMSFNFHLERTTKVDDAEAVVDGDPVVYPQTPAMRHAETCNPAFTLSKVTWGKDLAMTNLRCTYQGSDNRLHFTIDGHNPDFPAFEVRASATNDIILEMPLAESKETTWEPQISITKLPFTCPDQRKVLEGGMILRTTWSVDVTD